MTRLTYYKKSRFHSMGFDCTPQTLTKDDIIGYITGCKPKCIGSRLKLFSWKKLMGIFYLMNASDARKSWDCIVSSD